MPGRTTDNEHPHLRFGERQRLPRRATAIARPRSSPRFVAATVGALGRVVGIEDHMLKTTRVVGKSGAIVSMALVEDRPDFDRTSDG